MIKTYGIANCILAPALARPIDAEHVDMLARTLEHGIVLPPPKAYLEDATPNIFAGVHTFLAAKKVGKTEIDLMIVDEPSPLELRRDQFGENTHRKNFTVDEEGAMMAEILSITGWTQAKLADFLDVSEGRVAKVLRTHRDASPQLKASDLPKRTIIAVSKLPTHEAQNEMLERVIAGELKVEAVEKKVNDALKKRGPKTVKRVKLESASGVVLCFPGDMEAEAVKEDVKQLLKRIKPSDGEQPPDAYVPVRR